MWDKITYPSPNCNGRIVEVWEWISNFIPHFTWHTIKLSMVGLKLGDKIAVHLNVFGALPVGAAPITSSFSTWFQWIQQRNLRDETRNIYFFRFHASYIRGLTASAIQMVIETTFLNRPDSVNNGKSYKQYNRFERNYRLHSHTLCHKDGIDIICEIQYWIVLIQTYVGNILN